MVINIAFYHCLFVMLDLQESVYFIYTSVYILYILQESVYFIYTSVTRCSGETSREGLVPSRCGRINLHCRRTPVAEP